MRRSFASLALLLGLAGAIAGTTPTRAAFPGANGRIVFESDRDSPGAAGTEIYTANADGSDPRRLTVNTVADTDPAYSPDGSKIAFTRSNDIWVMNADGSGPRNLTDHPAQDTSPAWSPDGKRLAFVSTRGGGSDIYLLDVK